MGKLIISDNEFIDIGGDAVVASVDSSTDIEFNRNRMRGIGGRGFVLVHDVRRVVESLSPDEKAHVQAALKECQHDKGKIISILSAIPGVASKLSAILKAGTDAVDLYEKLRDLFK